MGIKKGVKAWLIFFRAHTAILEAPMAALGAGLGLGTFWSIEVLKWALFGVMYHYVGYGMNSYADWKKGYDKNDPNKSHHPLNTGDIKPSTAKMVVQSLLVAMIAYAFVLTGLDIVSLTVLGVMLASGIAYNYIGKSTKNKYILVAIVHTTVFVLPYVTYTKEYMNIVWVAAIAYFIHHCFQILISGDVKDIDRDESSLIQSVGMELEHVDDDVKVLNVSQKVVALSYIFTVLECIVVISMLLFLEPPLFSLVITGMMMVWMLIEVDDIIGEGIYNREARVSAMSRKELAGLWMIFGAFSGQLGIDAWLVMVVLSMAYFIPISQMMWGSMTPDV